MAEGVFWNDPNQIYQPSMTGNPLCQMVDAQFDKAENVAFARAWTQFNSSDTVARFIDYK